MHSPAVHPDGHARPHPPQLLSSDLMSRHRPLHMTLPAGHWQTLPEQVIPDAQMFPQAPQFT
jgi:hypothetical protein